MAGAPEIPRQARDKIGQIDVGKFAVGALGDGIKISDQGEQHGSERKPGNDLRSDVVGVVCAQVARQSDTDEGVGDDEAVSGEGSHPAVDVEATGSASEENGDGEDCGGRSEE